MATTTWIAGSGDWNTASNWSNGVPTAADTAAFTTDAAAEGDTYTVTGDGPAAALVVDSFQQPLVPVLAGSHALGTLVVDGAGVELAAGAALALGSGSIAGTLRIDPGATLGSAPLALDGATVVAPSVTGGGSSGTLANPLTLAGTSSIVGSVTLAGPIGGAGALHLAGGSVVLDGAGSSLPGGLQVGDLSPYELGPGATAVTVGGGASLGPVLLGDGTLTLAAGVTAGPITAGTGYGTASLALADQSATVFAGQVPLTVGNGSGHSMVLGATTPGEPIFGEGPLVFGAMTVTGGSGSVTVFGGNSGGRFQGGSAGHNLLVGGADLSGYPPTVPGFTTYQGLVAYDPAPVTLVGGGDGDVLVSAGTDNGAPNVLIAGGGAETLTGSGSTARAFLFGGTGADLLALGGGYAVAVAGSGAQTIAGGAGTAAIFAGAGQDVILGGSGADYVQAGTGNATLFAGGGADLVGVVAGQAGGSLVLSGFRVGTDRLDLQGYGGGMSGITGRQVTGGSTVLTLVDGTHVTLLGVTGLGAGSFV